MIGRLNHIGVATPSIEASVRLYRDVLGATRIHAPFDLIPQEVRVCFVDLPNMQIELIEPLGPTSPIARFLEKNPAGGQHHVCLEVDDLAEAAGAMRERGATILGPPRTGAHGTPVIFVHPRDMGGVLVELMQAPKRRERGVLAELAEARCEH